MAENKFSMGERVEIEQFENHSGKKGIVDDWATQHGQVLYSIELETDEVVEWVPQHQLHRA